MGQQDDYEINRAQEYLELDPDRKLKTMLVDAFEVGVRAYMEARSLTDQGKSKGVLGWQAIGERAIGEIVRLKSLISNDNEKLDTNRTAIYEYDEAKEEIYKEIIASNQDAEA